MLFKFVKRFVLIFTTVHVAACSTPKLSTKTVEAPMAQVVTAAAPIDSTRTDVFLEELLKKHPAYFDSILANRKDWNVQFIYTQVDRGANGMPLLKNYYFNLNSARYFYPASTVKFPVSILALQRLNELKIRGLDKNTAMITEQAFSGQTA